ncbi:MAG: DUF4340 domain-containing protein [Cyanobacteria bacterium P01_E01_bin.6]
MKLKAPTVFLVGIAAILGLVVFAEFQGGDRTDTETEAQPLFSFDEEDVQSFSVETDIETLAFERDAEGVWKMVQPETFLASDASVSFLLNLLATGESDRTFAVSADELGDFGLADPQAMIDIVLQDETSHQIVLGDFDFSQQSMYARVDAEIVDAAAADTVDIVLVPTTFDAAVNRSVEDWQQIESDVPAESGIDETVPEELETEVPLENSTEEVVPEESEFQEGASEEGEPQE